MTDTCCLWCLGKLVWAEMGRFAQLFHSIPMLLRHILRRTTHHVLNQRVELSRKWGMRELECQVIREGKPGWLCASPCWRNCAFWRIEGPPLRRIEGSCCQHHNTHGAPLPPTRHPATAESIPTIPLFLLFWSFLLLFSHFILPSEQSLFSPPLLYTAGSSFPLKAYSSSICKWIPLETLRSPHFCLIRSTPHSRLGLLQHSLCS